MKRLLIHRALLVAIALFLQACGEPADSAAPPGQPLAIDGAQACDNGATIASAHLIPRLAVIGPSSSALVAGSEHLWIVESGSNTVSRLAHASGRLDEGFIDIGNDRNPYAVAVDEELNLLYVANFAANSVSVADSQTGAIVEELVDERFKSPSAVTFTDKFIYVTNVNYIGLAEGYGPGSVVVIERESRETLGSVETTHLNPQFIARLQTADGERVVVSNSGALKFSGGAVVVESEGSLEVWTQESTGINPERAVYAMGQVPNGGGPASTGAPGQVSMTPDKRYLYAVSGIAADLFKLDLVSGAWVHDAQNPLRLYAAAGDVTHSSAMDSNGILYITSFNQDALYLWDTACDELLTGPIDLGTRPTMLEGPQSLALLEGASGVTAYFIMSISNAVGKADFTLVPVQDQP